MARISGTTAWLLALTVTLGLATYQRMTGPTRPLRGQVAVADGEVRYRLLRSHGGPGGLAVRVAAAGELEGVLLWRRFPTSEPWREVPLRREGGALAAEIPHQPPAGKVEYRVALRGEDAVPVVIPPDRAAVARFKGSVPAAVLVPHIAAMFLAMLVATRAAIGALLGPPGPVRRQVVVAAVLLTVGGLILGPVVQKHAFGAYWTGWPFGDDLTDTKTLVAVLAWWPAVLAGRRRAARALILAGWVVLMGVYAIPHSTRGSQLDWSQLPAAAHEPPGPS